MRQSKGAILSRSGFYSRREGPVLEFNLGEGQRRARTPTVTILLISLSAGQYNLESDWADAGRKVIVRHCPTCVHDCIVGHGRHRKPELPCIFSTGVIDVITARSGRIKQQWVTSMQKPPRGFRQFENAQSLASEKERAKPAPSGRVRAWWRYGTRSLASPRSAN